MQRIFRTKRITKSAVSAILSLCLSSSAILNQNLKIFAIFNFEITWASNPISLANWLIWLSPIHTFHRTRWGICLSRPQNIKHDRYFPLGLAWRNSQENSPAHERKQLSKLPCQAISLSCFLSSDSQRTTKLSYFTFTWGCQVSSYIGKIDRCLITHIKENAYKK